MDTALFNSLLLTELDALWRFALHLSRDEHTASDLTQETCTKALDSADSFSPKGGGLRSWLFAICHNVWRNQKRDGRFEKNGIADEVMEENEASSVETYSFEISKLDWEKMDERLKKAIDALPQSHRMPLLLWAIEDMPYREIAQVLEIPIGTVMSRLSRARTLLMESLTELAQEQGFTSRMNKTEL